MTDGHGDDVKYDGDFAARPRGRRNLGAMPFIAVMAAVMCIVGPLSIPLPVSPAPVSFTNLAIYLAVYLLGARAGTISYLIYLMLGLVGLPVFSGFTGGLSKVAGPTGGYLIGFVALALICGFFNEKFHGNRLFYVTGMILGMAVTYAAGAAWLAWQGNLTPMAALLTGVVPFIPGDAVKIIAVALVCAPARKLMARATGTAYNRNRPPAKQPH
jgi:biotin transport system substrate-specific component